jgi:hypothetical protein
METLTLARAAALGVVAGSTMALGIMAVFSARSIYIITRAGRMYQLRKLLKG